MRIKFMNKSQRDEADACRVGKKRRSSSDRSSTYVFSDIALCRIVTPLAVFMFRKKYVRIIVGTVSEKKVGVVIRRVVFWQKNIVTQFFFLARFVLNYNRVS